MYDGDDPDPFIPITGKINGVTQLGTKKYIRDIEMKISSLSVYEYVENPN